MSPDAADPKQPQISGFSFRKAFSTNGPSPAEYVSISLDSVAPSNSYQQQQQPMSHFPKSEAIKAARSISPTEQIEESWGNLPSKLKAKLVPRMTGSGSVTLKAIDKTQKPKGPSATTAAAGSKYIWNGKHDLDSKAPAASGKRKGSESASVGPAASALAPINDVEDGGWTTVVSGGV